MVIFKICKFSLELSRPITGMIAYCSNNCIITSSNRNACNVAQRSWESAPILDGEQPEDVEDSEVALDDPRCVAQAHHTAALSD